jgi:glucans biosynthesis protein C
MEDEKAAAYSTGGREIASSAGRLPGLEELRALAAVLVVGLHAGVPYLQTRMIALAWPMHDPHPSAIVDALFWCIECFIMPLFFVLSGWSAATLLHKNSAWLFFADRTRRVLVPLLVGSLIVLPVLIYTWVTGWIIFLNYPLHKFSSLRFDGEIRGNLWGFAHLWYLEYLYIYCLVMAAGAWLLAKWRTAGVISLTSKNLPGPEALVRPKEDSPALALRAQAEKGAKEDSPSLTLRAHSEKSSRTDWVLLPVSMVLLGSLVLAWDNRIVLGFYQTFHPILSKLLYYAIYFFAGVTLKQLPRAQAGVRRWSGSLGLVAAMTFAVLLPLIHARPRPGFSRVEHIMLASALAIFAVSTTLGIFGAFLKREKPAQPWVIAVAEASLWIYLMHMPTVGLVHIDLADWAAPAVLKYGIVWAMALVWTLLTYAAVVRKTWLGRLLHGERRLPQRDFSMTMLRAMFATSRSRAA